MNVVKSLFLLIATFESSADEAEDENAHEITEELIVLDRDATVSSIFAILSVKGCNIEHYGYRRELVTRFSVTQFGCSILF